MIRFNKRASAFAGLLFAAATALASAAVDTRAARIDAAIRATPLAGSHFGVLVTEIPSGRILYQRNADDAFVPASTVKVVTGATALETLGRSARFVTTLALRGSQQGTRFDGDVIVHGDGDPSLLVSDLREATAALQQLGIASVRGTIAVENSIAEANTYPDGWLIDDRPFGYAAPPSDIFLEGNSVRARLRPASAAGMRGNLTLSAHDAAVYAVLGLRLVNTTETVRYASDDAEAEPFWQTAIAGVTGPVALGDAPTQVDIAVPDARAFMRAQLLTLMHETGIAVQAAPSSPDAVRRVVWTHRSPPVADLVKTMWTRSDNQYAEALLLHVGAAVQGGGDPRARGLARETAFLRRLGIDAHAVVLNDGSGLSRYDLARPRAFARLYTALWATPVRADLLAGLPLAARRGTLLNAFSGTPIAGAYFAKTGGMRNVANMTGYLKSASHGWLTVSMFADDAPVDDAVLRRLQTQILRTYID